MEKWFSLAMVFATIAGFLIVATSFSFTIFNDTISQSENVALTALINSKSYENNTDAIDVLRGVLNTTATRLSGLNFINILGRNSLILAEVFGSISIILGFVGFSIGLLEDEHSKRFKFIEFAIIVFVIAIILQTMTYLI